MKFVADGMLGKLTRWLRILGHNVKYSNRLEDSQLIAIAKKERRILLTRDLELYQQAAAKKIQAFYVDGQTEAERLAKIAEKFGITLDVDMAKSRCPKCNAHVKPILKEKVAGKVEDNTLSHYDEFWQCLKCGQIYWQGAHWKRIRETLESAKTLCKNRGV
ncbi:MAG: Mut7-C RNAse domain-containing protein [Candidatus Bathyarchaeia archaeon]